MFDLELEHLLRVLKFLKTSAFVSALEKHITLLPLFAFGVDLSTKNDGFIQMSLHTCKDQHLLS